MPVKTLHLGLLLGICTGPSLIAQPKVHPDELKLKPKIDAAIGRGVEVLIQRQMRDGTWGLYGNYDGGKSALCAYALLKCGVAADHPAVRRALLYIDRIKQPEQTYTVACIMLAYAATGQPEYIERLKPLARKLIEWQRGGDFGYPHHHGRNTGWSRPDLSNTQYAALGLWIAQKHGVRVPLSVWRKLANSTLRYQSRPEKVTLKRTGEHTVSAGKVEINGFGYGYRGKATGSMTAAGVSILQICKIGMGSRVGALRRKIDDAIEGGVDWLGHHFSVDKNPGKGGWLHYYLYGLERVGSLTRREQFGSHWWYLKGARKLIGTQRGDGGWPKRASNHWEVQTAFALLFLRRATGMAAVTGGTARSGKKRDLFAAGNKTHPVQIGGAGQQPLSLWVSGFGDALAKKHEAHGLRVVLVEYLDGKRVLGQVAGDPRKPWTTRESYLYRASALQRGSHAIRARIKLIRADQPSGDSPETEIVHSPVMKVQVRDVFAEWMEVATHIAKDNLLRTAEKEVTATSNGKNAKLVADGRDSTHWVCGPKDKAPSLTIETTRAVPTRQIGFTQAGVRIGDIGNFDNVREVELWINRDRDPIRVKLHADQLAVTVFTLPRLRRIRSLVVKVIRRRPGRRKGQAGFSEIALLK